MIEAITELFKCNGFDVKKTDYGNFFLIDEELNKTTFWLVIQETDIDSFLERQPLYVETCKKVCKHFSLEKNLSMLILWDTGGNSDIGTMKRKIMTLEEDPYFSKKYVLYFSKKERDELYEIVEDKNINVFIKSQIASQDIFSQYKNNATLQSWQALLYRIAIKMPFIKIDIDASEGLSSLFDKNQQKLEDVNNELNRFDQEIFKLFELTTFEELKEKDANQILSELLQMDVWGDASGD